MRVHRTIPCCSITLPACLDRPYCIISQRRIRYVHRKADSYYGLLMWLVYVLSCLTLLLLLVVVVVVVSLLPLLLLLLLLSSVLWFIVLQCYHLLDGITLAVCVMTWLHVLAIASQRLSCAWLVQASESSDQFVLLQRITALYSQGLYYTKLYYTIIYCTILYSSIPWEPCNQYSSGAPWPEQQTTLNARATRA